MSHFSKSIKALSCVSISLQMEEWEIEVGLLKKFVRLTDANRGLFFALLGKKADLDSYITSPVYYALTGRKGLWIYQDQNAFIPLCWHPNVDGQILIFPPQGESNQDILRKMLVEIPIPPAGLRIARLKNEDINAPLIQKIQGSLGRPISLSRVEETVLDWRYPVRTLSTDRVRSMHGSAFMRARNHLKQLERHTVSVFPLTSRHEAGIIEFAHRWAGNRTSDPSEIRELVSPYKEAMNLLNDEAFRLGGHVFFVDGQIQAATMWEYPNNALKIANAWVSLCNTNFKGLSEFVMKTTAEALCDLGIPYINYGGSETKGLDDYKNKYVPAYSIDLCSVDVAVSGVDPILHSLIKIQNSRIAA